MSIPTPVCLSCNYLASDGITTCTETLILWETHSILRTASSGLSSLLVSTAMYASSQAWQSALVSILAGHHASSKYYVQYCHLLTPPHLVRLTFCSRAALMDCGDALSPITTYVSIAEVETRI